jgi:hypothetical protein
MWCIDTCTVPRFAFPRVLLPSFLEAALIRMLCRSSKCSRRGCLPKRTTWSMRFSSSDPALNTPACSPHTPTFHIFGLCGHAPHNLLIQYLHPGKFAFSKTDTHLWERISLSASCGVHEQLSSGVLAGTFANSEYELQQGRRFCPASECPGLTQSILAQQLREHELVSAPNFRICTKSPARPVENSRPE